MIKARVVEAAGALLATLILGSQFRAFSASRLHTFLNVKVLSAAGSIFAGLQIAVVLSFIGAVVGDFVTAKQGLSFLIQTSSLNFDVPTMFAAIVTLACLGILGTGLVRLAHRRFIFWEERRSRRSSLSETAAI